MAEEENDAAAANVGLTTQLLLSRKSESASPSFSLDDPLVTTPAELDYPIQDDEDIKLMAEFEDAWVKFIKDNPSIAPRGKKDESVWYFQEKVREAIQHKAAVQAELQGQLKSFQTGFEKVEENAQKETKVAKRYQKQLNEHLQKELDNVTIANHHMASTIPWQHFVASLDRVAAPQAASSSSDHHHIKNNIKPSHRAFHMIGRPAGNNPHDELRAFRMDNALLQTQIKMLHQELEQYDKTSESLRVVGKFLTEQNIWGLLAKDTGSVASGSTASKSLSTKGHKSMF